MFTRREFLKAASLMTVGGAMGGSLTSCGTKTADEPAAKAAKKFGLQIWSLGQELYEGDVAENIKRIKEMGYYDIELAGYNEGKIGSVPMMDFKKMCDDVDLKITCSHCNPPVWEYKEDNVQQILDYWKKTFEDHKQLGMDIIVQPAMPAIKTVGDAKFVSDVFNKVGEECQKSGMKKFGYHNHSGEFARVTEDGSAPERGKGERIMDIFLQHTDAAKVFFELDVYWAVMGQCDPVALIRNNREKITALHIKDDAVLGQSGFMNFEQIFKAAYEGENPIRTYYVEIEKFPEGCTHFQGAKECADYLNNAPFVL